MSQQLIISRTGEIGRGKRCRLFNHFNDLHDLSLMLCVLSTEINLVKKSIGKILEEAIAPLWIRPCMW